jgi:hypothetical protein
VPATDQLAGIEVPWAVVARADNRDPASPGHWFWVQISEELLAARIQRLAWPVPSQEGQGYGSLCAPLHQLQRPPEGPSPLPPQRLQAPPKIHLCPLHRAHVAMSGLRGLTQTGSSSPCLVISL